MIYDVAWNRSRLTWSDLKWDSKGAMRLRCPLRQSSKLPLPARLPRPLDLSSRGPRVGTAVPSLGKAVSTKGTK